MFVDTNLGMCINDQTHNNPYLCKNTCINNKNKTYEMHCDSIGSYKVHGKKMGVKLFQNNFFQLKLFKIIA
jgi:hypothetical protein